MRGLLRNTVIFGLALLLIVGASMAWAQESPMEVVKHVITKSLDILANTSIPKAQRRQQVKNVVNPHFDYREMAKLSLGPTWYQISSGQRNEFVGLFANLLEASYSSKIIKYAQRVKIDYTRVIPMGENRVEVRTVVVKPNDRIPLNYRLLKAQGTWKVYDVVIEGVSLVANYRSQFRRIIHRSSYADLVRRLQTKVSEMRNTG